MKKGTLRTIASVLFLFVMMISPNTFSQDSMKLHFVDVGQGNAALLEFSCGVIMIDTGGEESDDYGFSGINEISDYLGDFFLKRPDLNNTIDLLVLTHPHLDHTRAARTIFDLYDVENVITNGKRNGSGRHNQNYIQDEIEELGQNSNPIDDVGYYRGITDNVTTNGATSTVIDPINCGNGNDPEVTILWGTMIDDQDLSRTEYNNGNNHSIVMKVKYGMSSILFPGDLEEDAIELLIHKYNGSNMLDVDVYVVGHHFSRNGTTREFLGAMTPEIAIGGFGDHTRRERWTAWDFGHPNIDIVEMLEDSLTGTRGKTEVWVGDGGENFSQIEIEKAIYGTGWDGDLVFEANYTGGWTNISQSNISQSNAAGLININTATQLELESLPQIGPSRARAIIEYREANGDFLNADELDDVRGIGMATINLIREKITF